MMINNLVAKVIFLAFALWIFLLRLGTVKSNKELKNKKVEGRVYAVWTHKALFFLYFIMFFGTLLEFMVLRKTLNLSVSLTGLGMCIFGFNARKWAVNALGKYWSNNIEIREDHPIIREGPYRYVRHPNYLFLTMEFFGFAMTGNAYWTMLFLLVIYIPVIAARTIVEEKKMVEKFGDTYIQYKKEVPAFIPWKWKM